MAQREVEKLREQLASTSKGTGPSEERHKDVRMTLSSR